MKRDKEDTIDTAIKALTELKELYELLQVDVSKSLNLLQGKGDQFASRVFIRSVFASIEGIVFRLKQAALEVAVDIEADLSKPEIALLAEETYELGEKGEPITKTSFLQLQKNLKFAFHIFARVFDIEYKLKVDDAGWASFLGAIKIRNRITHPKHVQDIEISVKDVEIVSAALMWFTKSELALVTIATEAVRQRAAEGDSA
jgi:hypothetical protein